MPHTQECKSKVNQYAREGYIPEPFGYCIGGCSMTREDYPELFEILRGKTEAFGLPDHREKEPHG